MIPLLRPTFDEATKKELLDTMESGWWGQGPKVLKLEKNFPIWAFGEDYTAWFAIATSSCTAALDLTLKAYGITSGELITTPMTFVADAAVGEWNGMDVTFADINPATLCIEPESIKITPETKAIIAVDCHGRLADCKRIKEIIGDRDILLIEDAAHAAFTPGVGKYSDVVVWSFQAVKTIPAGDGGMVTTKNEEIARKIKNMTWLGIEKNTWSRNNGKYDWDYDIKHQGTKSYMNDINASIVLGQMENYRHRIAKRRAIQSVYNEGLKDVPQVKLPLYSHTVQYYTPQFERRDELSQYLATYFGGTNGFATSVHFKPLSEMTYWKMAVKNPLPNTEVWKKLLTLPCHDALTFHEIETVMSAIKKFYA